MEERLKTIRIHDFKEFFQCNVCIDLCTFATILISLRSESLNLADLLAFRERFVAGMAGVTLFSAGLALFSICQSARNLARQNSYGRR
jgi:hypothetical protein